MRFKYSDPLKLLVREDQMHRLVIVYITIAITLLAACTEGVEEFDVLVKEAGVATNPCLDAEPLSGFVLTLSARVSDVRLSLNHNTVMALDENGRVWPALSFIPMDPRNYQLERTGSMTICGGAGGITISSSDDEWGSTRQSNLMFPDVPDADEENRFEYVFEENGRIDLGLFFAAPFDTIEAIELSNTQRIPKSAWTAN